MLGKAVLAYFSQKEIAEWLTNAIFRKIKGSNKDNWDYINSLAFDRRGTYCQKSCSTKLDKLKINS